MKAMTAALIVLFTASSALAISFTNGKWSSTFNYSSECSQRGADPAYPINCDNVRNDQIRWTWGDKPVMGRYTRAVNDANFTGGEGGKGFRSWVGDGTNEQSGLVRIDLSPAQKELWIRWYMKYQQGFKWQNNSIGYNKTFYMLTTDTGTELIPSLLNHTFTLSAQGTGAYQNVPAFAGGGWSSTYGPGESNGQWHCFEMHIKMDTTGTPSASGPGGAGEVPFNGVGRVWLNGVLLGERLNVNYSHGNKGGSRTGWTRITWNNNQTSVANAGGSIGQAVAYVDYDDIVIYNVPPPNTDAHGNRFIGPIGWGGGSPAPTCSPSRRDLCDAATCGPIGGGYWYANTCNATPEIVDPGPDPDPTPGALLLSESFEDNNWLGRNWYDGTNSTGVVPGGYIGNALRLVWASGATRPTGFTAVRKKFTPSTEMLIEYRLFHESGWQGSGKSYHPHILLIQSQADTDYQALANSRSTLYMEAIADPAYAWALRTTFAHQDSLRVNTSSGTPPNDLRLITESRSANQCNTPASASGGSGICYSTGGGYYSANLWMSSPAITIPIGEWARMRYYIKRNTIVGGKGQFDGKLKVWVNDVVAIDRSDVLYVTGAYDTAWDKAVIAPWIGDGSPKPQAMWIDELKIYSGIIEPDPDPIIPRAPRLLRIGDSSPFDIGGKVLEVGN